MYRYAIASNNINDIIIWFGYSHLRSLTCPNYGKMLGGAGTENDQPKITGHRRSCVDDYCEAQKREVVVSNMVALLWNTTVAALLALTTSIFGFLVSRRVLDPIGIALLKIHDDPVVPKTPTTVTLSESLKHASKAFLFQRQAEYAAVYNETNGKHWGARGLGWLYQKKGIVLTAIIPDSPISVGKHSVSIWNVGANRIDCHSLTIWVRVSGPEIFAGTAHAINSTSDKSDTCHWSFALDIRISGHYLVDAKVLVWNGKAPVDPQECSLTKPSKHTVEKMLSHRHRERVTSFKFEEPQYTCCEICTRVPHCVYWSFPSPSDIFGAKSCELYFDDRSFPNLTEPVLAIDKEMQPTPESLLNNSDFKYGRPRKQADTFFLGCGWSFWLSLEYPCLSPELDDQIHMMQRSFSVSPSNLMLTSSMHEQIPSLPNCTVLHEEHASLGFLNSRAAGRWVRESWPDNTVCPLSLQVVPRYSEKFENHQHDGEHPHCWNREDFTLIGNQCVQNFCQKLVKEAWVSHIRREKHWFGTWKPYNCKYQEFTDHDLQACITKRNILSITLHGRSLANFLNQYLQLRLQRIHMANATRGGTHVLLHTFAHPHLLWKQSPADWVQELEKRIIIASSFELQNNLTTHNLEHYWTTGFYFSSERQAFIHQGRSEHFTEVASEYLARRHPEYRMLSAMDLTAAFTFDAATQQDGLHIIGPPMKMMITKLFHHMCMS